MLEVDSDPLARSRPALNPYRVAASFVLRRLRWDMHPQSWRSRRVMRSWQDRFPKGKAVILCNGPSLLNVDFDLLSRSNTFCFGLNKINLLFSKTSFRPNCIVAVNPFVIEQNAPFFNETELPLFLDTHAVGFVEPRPNVAYLHSNPFHFFARDCALSIFQGYTVTFVALELAFHLGFREVALVGADHTFAEKGPGSMTVVSGAHDSNHFDPTYFSGGMKWQLPDLFESEVGYTMARNVFQAFGGRVVNASVGGKLEVFERQTLEEFLR